MVDELLVYLEGNIRFTIDYLQENLPAVKVVPPEATYMIWLDFRGTGLSMDEINDRLIKEAKVALNDGYMFGETGAGFQRMNIACPRKIVEQALERIVSAFQSKA